MEKVDPLDKNNLVGLLISKDTSNEKQLIGVFKVIKRGNRGMTSNARILVVTENNSAYYNMPTKKNKTLNFFKTLEKLYDNKKEPKTEELEKDFAILIKEFNENLTEFSSLMKEQIPYEFCETLYDSEDKDFQKDFPKDWLFKAIIRQKNSDGKKNKNPEIYSNLKQNISEKQNVEKKKIEWRVNFIKGYFLAKYQKLLDEIKKKKTGTIIKEIAVSKQQEIPKNLPKIIKKEEETIKKEEQKKTKEEGPEVDPEVIQVMYYHEICYQYLLKQYYNASQLGDIKLRMKYEFSILQIQTKFKEICQTICKRIVADLYAKPFQQQNNSSSYYLFPIVFPYPSKLKKSEQAVFLYYINGINFTLTWHQTIFKIRSDQKLELEDVPLNGAWHNLNIEFKNRDFFNDLMGRLSKDFPSRLDMPRFPISCMVDYCGFRILCEADIYVDDGGSVVMRRIDSMSSQMNNDQNNHFYKEIATLISYDKANSNSANSINYQSGSVSMIKGDKEIIQPNMDILIPVSYQNKEFQRHNSRIFGFQNVIKYHSKEFKQVDNYIFNKEEIQKIIVKQEKTNQIKNKDLNNNTSGNNPGEYFNNSVFITTPIKEPKDSNINLDNPNQIKNEIDILRKKANEFFELTSESPPVLNLKDFKETFKYIMDLKVLIEIKDKFFESSSTSGRKQGSNINGNNFDSGTPPIPKRSIYFRPEFLIQYLKETGVLNLNVNDRELDANELFIKNLRKYLYLDDSGQPQYKNIIETYKHFLDNHLNYFFNCLDTMYFKPYDSESLTEIFHRYGVNMFYLGRVAEDTGAPHIRELCLIEMISRICKKMIFDMISFKIIKRANEDYYLGINDHGKNFVEYDYSNNSSEPYLNFVPVTFFVRYWRDYLKKLHVLGSENFKCYYYEENNSKSSNITARGLYRRFWQRCTNYTEKEIKPIFQVKEEKVGGKVNKENNESLMLSESKKEIIQFLNVLFDFDNKHSFKYLNVDLDNKTLWATILDRVKQHYNIDNRDIFVHCDPMYISLPALFSSIQYHTGITVNFSVVVNTQYNNKDLINKEFTEEMIDIKPRVKVYNFRQFLVNREKTDTIRNNYSLLYEDALYRKVLLRFFTEKFQKSVSTYTWTYLHYMNSLRRLEHGQHDKVVDWIHKNESELKDKIKTESDYPEYFRSQFTHLSFKFESVHYLFMAIIESYVNREESANNMLNVTGTQSSSKNFLSGALNEYIRSANDYITDYWFTKHPFVCLLNIIVARLNLKTIKNLDEKTEANYKIALAIARDSLGSINIFVANLCEEIAYCYIKSNNFYEGTRHYKLAYNVFKEHKEEFTECYFKNLRNITKYFIVLGYYKDALEFGQELVKNYFENPRKVDFYEKFDIKVIMYNLILVANSLGDHETGADFCRKLLYDFNGNKHDINFEITKFRDWSNHQKNKNKNQDAYQDEKTETITLFQVVLMYLRLIIKNLKDAERLVYIQALVTLIENKEEREKLKSLGEGDQFKDFRKFFVEIKDQGEFGKYFSKMLENVRLKFEQEKSYQKVNESTLTEIEKNYKESWEKFKLLYKIFQNDRVFTNYIDSDILNAYTK